MKQQNIPNHRTWSRLHQGPRNTGHIVIRKPDFGVNRTVPSVDFEEVLLFK